MSVCEKCGNQRDLEALLETQESDIASLLAKIAGLEADKFAAIKANIEVAKINGDLNEQVADLTRQLEEAKVPTPICMRSDCTLDKNLLHEILVTYEQLGHIPTLTLEWLKKRFTPETAKEETNG